MTKLKTLAAAAALLASGMAAAATTYNAGSYSVVYDETTSFKWISQSFSSGADVGFEWSVSPTVTLTSLGPVVSATFAVPDFKIVANAGYVLHGNISASLGNIVYAVAPGSFVAITATGSFAVDGGAASTLSDAQLVKTITSAYNGYFSGSTVVPAGQFSSFEVTDASIELTAMGSFANITAQPQNKLAFSFSVTAVPEPESYALLLAGLGVVGLLARRRQVR